MVSLVYNSPLLDHTSGACGHSSGTRVIQEKNVAHRLGLFLSNIKFK